MIRGLLGRWRRWRAYEAHLSRAIRDEVASGYKVTGPKLERMKQQAWEAALSRRPAR